MLLLLYFATGQAGPSILSRRSTVWSDAPPPPLPRRVPPSLYPQFRARKTPDPGLLAAYGCH
jgi:hypothetical protein